MPITADLVQQALAAARAGDKPAAKTLLTQVVRQEPDSPRAWYLLSQLEDYPAQAAYCLEQVLRLEPGHPQAQARLQRLQGAGGVLAGLRRPSTGMLLAVLAGVLLLCVLGAAVLFVLNSLSPAFAPAALHIPLIL